MAPRMGASVPVKISRKNNRVMISGNTQFPSDLGPNQMLFVFRKYEYRSPGTIKLNSVQNISGEGSLSVTAVNSISFPIPSNLQDQNEARIGRFDMNYLGEKIASGISQIENGVPMADNLSKVMGALGSADGGAAADAIKNMQTTDLVGDAMYLMRAFNTTAAKSVSIGAGKTANPKAALAYDGHELKNHSFIWNLAPRSEEESTNLRNIISFIKHNQLPNVGGVSDNMMFLRYPCIVDVYFIGVDENYFYTFKPCMIRSFNVNYSGQNNVAILRGGRPASINIEMNLMEMDIHYANEYVHNGIGGTNYNSGDPDAHHGGGR